MGATLGERIAAERQRAGLTQRQLAELVGIAQPTLANIEGGKREVKFATVQAIAGALKLPVWKLVKPL